MSCNGLEMLVHATLMLNSLEVPSQKTRKVREIRGLLKRQKAVNIGKKGGSLNACRCCHTSHVKGNKLNKFICNEVRVPDLFLQGL